MIESQIKKKNKFNEGKQDSKISRSEYEMNVLRCNSLSLPIGQLLPNHYHVLDPNIVTIKDLLDHSWGMFHAYSGIGKMKSSALSKGLDELGIDIGEYIASLPPTVPVPELITKYCLEKTVYIKEDLKKLSRKEVLWCSIFDLNITKYILKSLNNMGIQHLEEGDKIILETEDLPTRIKRGLFLQGYYTEFDVLDMSEQEVISLKTIGLKNLPILIKWRFEHHRNKVLN